MPTPTKKTPKANIYSAKGNDCCDPPLESELQSRADRLRLAVRRAGGNKVVCERLGLPLASLQNYMNGRDMRATTVIKLADTCGVDRGWLLDGRNAEAADASPSTQTIRMQSDLDAERLRQAAAMVLAVQKTRNAPQSPEVFSKMLSFTYDNLQEAAEQPDRAVDIMAELMTKLILDNEDLRDPPVPLP